MSAGRRDDRIGCTVGILTFNSATVLERALRSVGAFDEVLVCDGGSTDGTREIAQRYGCRVIDQPSSSQDRSGRLIDIAACREHIVSVARHDWIFMLDSDEYMSDGLVDEIRGVVESAPEGVVFRVPRLYVDHRGTIECAPTYPRFQTRFVNRACLTGYDGLVHDVPSVAKGVELRDLTEPQLVPLEAFTTLWRKWRTYLRLEEVKRQHLSVREWREVVVRPSLRHLRYLVWRSYRDRRDCRGRRLPIRYEVGFIIYTALEPWYTGRRFLGLGRPDLERAWD